ncbi:MAG: chromosome segregation protein SMC, partial [Candidatus Omnitrophota bacterium]
KYDPVSMAEVSLTLSNEDRALPVDYDEVTISRRLFRSGESVYFLNKTPVRLTDVRELLLGTGIGTSSYSIVEQGRLDMILNAKPEDRRYVFEEASGITKFKAKKREALLKLEHTRNNLIRITDIIHEVERQIKAIERHARKAEKYKAFYDQLKDLDVKLSYRNYVDLEKESSSLERSSGEIGELSGKLKAWLEEATGTLVRQKEEYNQVVGDLQATQGQVMKLRSDVDKNNHVMSVNGERIQELKRYTEQLDKEIKEISGRQDALCSRLERLEVRCSDITGQRRGKEEKLAGLEENVKRILGIVEENKKRMKENREKTLDIVSEQTKTKNMLIKMNADIQNMMARERRLRTEKSNVEAEKEAVSFELEKAEERAGQVREELDRKVLEFREFSDAYSKKQQELSALNEEKRNKEKRLNEIKPRREFLEKLISEREGIGESVKAIIRCVETGDIRLAGVRGILSEIINVGQGYEESLEFLLGDVSQAIVVETKEAAAHVIRYLEDNSLGNVSFVILDELEGSAGNFTPEDGRFSNVTRILAGDERCRAALCNMLRDVFVTERREGSGSLIEEGGVVTGRIIGEKGEVRQKGMYRSRNYSQKEMISLFGRREKVAQLREEEEGIKKQLSDISEAVRGLEEWLEKSVVEKERIEAELREKQMEFAAAQSRRGAVKEKVDALNDEILLLQTELEEEISSIKQLREEGEALNQRLNEIESESAKLEELIEESQGIIQEGAQEREKALYAISDLKAELSALRKEEENLTDNLHREKENYSRIDLEVRGRHDRIENNGRRAGELEKEISDLEVKNREHQAEIEKKSAEIEEKAGRKGSLEQVITQAESAIKRAAQELEEARNKARDVEISRKEIEYKRTNLIDKIRDAYKVDLSRIEVDLDGQSLDWEAARGQIEELRTKLDRMGEVSLGAMEEHDQLQQRYDFLVKQRDDLVKGEESLMQAIARINRTTRKMFVETFEAIRNEFRDYYRMLFNGGRADLILTDESNLLESGVDIVAKPPGKKLQNISLLSGGEKSLTAIALVFALFKVNPSPFCILDEIDAPLDESNVVRFSRVLQEFLKTSQFIIVTHNRTTIRLADVLYGVTMQEKGVSKIVSVKFKDEDELLAEEAAQVAA